MPKYRRVHARESMRLYPSVRGCLNFFGRGSSWVAIDVGMCVTTLIGSVMSRTGLLTLTGSLMSQTGPDRFFAEPDWAIDPDWFIDEPDWAVDPDRFVDQPDWVIDVSNLVDIISFELELSEVLKSILLLFVCLFVCCCCCCSHGKRKICKVCLRLFTLSPIWSMQLAFC